MTDERTKKILLVDDNETFLINVSIILHRMGFKKIIPAYTGLEALKLTRALMPDVILLDIAMPHMDGTTVLRHIKGDDYTSNIPVVMVTTASDKKSYEECKKLRCSGYLKKPVKIMELYNILNDCISYPVNKRRKFLRTLYKKKVIINCKGVREEQYAENLSQRGIFIRKRNPFKVGTEVGIALSLQGKEKINLIGKVLYVREGDVSETPVGMAIEFKDLTSNDSEILGKYIIELLTNGIIEDPHEPPLIVEK